MASQLKKYKKDVHQMSTKLQGVYNDLQEEQSHRMVDMFFISASKLNFSDFNLVSKIWNEQGCAFGFSGFGKFGSGSEKPESARVSVGQAVNLSSEFSGNSGIRVPE